MEGRVAAEEDWPLLRGTQYEAEYGPYDTHLVNANKSKDLNARADIADDGKDPFCCAKRNSAHDCRMAA